MHFAKSHVLSNNKAIKGIVNVKNRRAANFQGIHVDGKTEKIDMSWLNLSGTRY